MSETEASKIEAGVVRERIRRTYEGLFWLACAFFPLLLLIPDLVRYPPNSPRILLEELAGNSLAFVISFFIYFFPILFSLIFGDMPFAALRKRIKGRDQSVGQDQATIPGFNAESLTASRLSRLDPRELLALFSERTSETTKKIYTRSGVYLMVGVFISFTGLAFFYVRSLNLYPLRQVVINGADNSVALHSDSNDFVDRIINLIPGFGILFFIELIAFFFLRQYRSAMDEFRYFDSIRRNREESLVILKMFAENASVVSTKEVLDAMRLYSSAGVLSKDQTTEMMEARRLQADELVIFEKLVDVMSTLRKAEPEDKKAKK